MSGLTTALCLAREGFAVTVVAEKFAPDIVSVVAGALWEWPPAVCGHHQDAHSLERSKSWCMTSYDTFFDLARHEGTGVFVRDAVFFFGHPVEDCTGLGSMELAGDDMHPLRGALVRVHNDGHAMPRITKALCVSHDPAAGTQGMVFILPRGEDMLVLGGLNPRHPQLRPRRLRRHVLLGIRPRSRRPAPRRGERQRFAHGRHVMGRPTPGPPGRRHRPPRQLTPRAG